jgi:hypothetical protein
MRALPHGNICSIRWALQRERKNEIGGSRSHAGDCRGNSRRCRAIPVVSRICRCNNLQVEHQSVLVNTATGDIYTCIGTLALEKNGPRLSGLGCEKGEIKAGSAPKGTVVLTVGAHIPPGPFTGVWHVDQATGDVSCALKFLAATRGTVEWLTYHIEASASLTRTDRLAVFSVVALRRAPVLSPCRRGTALDVQTVRCRRRHQPRRPTGATTT